MNPKAKQIILYTTLIVIGIIFLVYGVVKAKEFLIPISIASLLSMVLLPIDRKLRQWSFPRGLSVLLSDLLLLAVSVGFIIVVAAQVENIVDKWPTYMDKLEPKIEKAQEYIQEKTGITPNNQEQKIKDYFQGARTDGGNLQLSNFFPQFISFWGNFLLVFVYIFFFLYYKDKFKNSILNFIPNEKRDKGEKIVKNFSRVSQQYLFGRFILILFLAIIYSIGLMIVGIKHAIFISVLAAALTIIPYIGNVIGVVLAIFMSVLTDGTLGSIVGILIVFSIAQFFESYILEPYIVGHKVEINPVVTIIGVVVGGMIWGLAGMIIAIPIMGILKAVFDNVPVLNPLGYVLDEQDTGSGDSWVNKLKNKMVSWFK